MWDLVAGSRSCMHVRLSVTPHRCRGGAGRGDASSVADAYRDVHGIIIVC